MGRRFNSGNLEAEEHQHSAENYLLCVYLMNYLLFMGRRFNGGNLEERNTIKSTSKGYIIHVKENMYKES